MKYIEEFRKKELVLGLQKRIHVLSKTHVRLMEVCGGHTMAIQKFGIHKLLPDTIELLSGPGCPVCVTSKKYIDYAIEVSRLDNVIITTFGDLIRVPGSYSSLMNEKASGADIRIVFSSLNALDMAWKNPSKKVVFLGIGFETTAPTSAATIQEAEKKGISNFFLLSSHKIMPPAMEALIDEKVKLNGYLCPGHVSTITGSDMYEPIVQKYGLSCVIAGFEPTDILQSIYMLVNQIEKGEPSVEIQYKRAVSREGNARAKQIMHEVFEPKDEWWRGFGVLQNSGLTLQKKYHQYDAEKYFDLSIPEPVESKGCICGTILKGLKTPKDCSLFKNQCTPENPVGACMVSHEGACQAYYRYADL